MPLFFLGTREWRNRQTRTVQVRVPVMEWGFNSPLAHDETADPSGSAVFVFPGCCLRPHGCSGRRVACLVGRAAPWAVARLIDGVACGAAGVPGAGGPGRCVCRWAAARPRDRHTRACGSEWSISRPALALPPPTGTAARPCASKPGQAPPPPINFARNSPAACSNIECASLELQRFWGVSKNDRDKLRAKYGWR